MGRSSTVVAAPSTSQGWRGATVGHPAWGCAGQPIVATCNQSHQQLSLLFSFLLASTFGDRGDRRQPHTDCLSHI